MTVQVARAEGPGEFCAVGLGEWFDALCLRACLLPVVPAVRSCRVTSVSVWRWLVPAGELAGALLLDEPTAHLDASLLAR